MPKIIVNGKAKKFPYTPKGVAEYRKAKRNNGSFAKSKSGR